MNFPLPTGLHVGWRAITRTRKKFAVIGLAVILAGSCGGGGDGGGTPLTRILSPTWTMGRTTPETVNLSRGDVSAVLDHIFTDQAVQSALVLKSGWVVGERYATGFTADSVGTSWSVAKSLYAAAIGVAVDEGFITSLDQKMSEFFSVWLGTNKEDITIRDVLEMRAGLPADTQIFFENDQTAYALNLGLVNTPGSTFVYSNPTSQLLSALLARATGMDAHTYLSQKVLAPIGINPVDTGLWFDRTGTNPLTYCCVDMKPDDFARFGLLFARGGEWDGSQVVSGSFVTQSLTAQSAFYGQHWWILNNRFFGTTVPVTVASAQGLDGQRIYVVPDSDVVVVVLTIYSHFQNQGFVLSDANFPDTCTARNSCPGTVGPIVPGYSEFQLVGLLAALQ